MLKINPKQTRKILKFYVMNKFYKWLRYFTFTNIYSLFENILAAIGPSETPTFFYKAFYKQIPSS